MSAKRQKPGQRQRRGARPRPAAELPEGPGEILLEESQIGPSVAMESILRVVSAMVDDREFETPEEIETYLESISEDQFRDARAQLMARSPREEAQQLAYEAMLEAHNDQDAAALARRALERDPDCIDALVILAELASRGNVDEYIAALNEIVAKGRAMLGDAFFEQHGDDLWETLEARPYMRAFFRFAESLRVSGRTRDAIQQFESLMELNPRDHQRARDPLLACYLAVDDAGGARKLLTRFATDDTAVFHWGRVLERYLSEDLEGALVALRRARRQNGHTEGYMTFSREAPSTHTETWAPGSQEEAIHCLFVMGLAWANYPAAIHWVRGQ